MSWRQAENPRLIPTGADSTGWAWTLTTEDGSIQRTVVVEISGTAMCCSDVHPRLDAARETDGRTEIMRIAGWDEPPERIAFHSLSVTPRILGGEPGPEVREITEIGRWFLARGVLMLLSAHGIGIPGGGLVSATHAANLSDRESGVLLQRLEAGTRLDAARSARRWWRERP